MEMNDEKTLRILGKLSGVLMDKATGEPLTVDGKQVTAEKEFTPKSESGTEEMSYTFNASALAGHYAFQNVGQHDYDDEYYSCRK